MILVELDIRAFGGLHDKKLTFGPGFNLVEGPNEQGKSTVLACLTALLYGLSGGPRNIRDNARRRYLPWDGGSARASLTVQHEGRLFRLERVFGKRRGEDAVSLTDDRTGAGIELPTGMEPGLLWTGLPASEFERSLLAGQLSVPVRDPDGTLLSRLTNLAATGQEEVSFPEADERLRRAQVRLRAERGSGGRINEAHRERDACWEQYHAAVAAAEQRAEDLRRLERLRSQREDARNKQARARTILEQRLEEEGATQAVYREAEHAYQASLESVRTLEAELDGLRQKRDEETAHRPPQPQRDRTSRVLLAVSVLLLVAGIVAAWLLAPVWIAGSGLALIPLVMGIQKRNQSGKQGSGPVDAKTLYKEQESGVLRRIQEQEAACERAHTRMVELRTRQASGTSEPLDRLRSREQARTEQLQRLQEEIAYLEAALHHAVSEADSLVERKQRLADLDEQIRSDEERYESLERARATLKAVQETWQNDLGPRLNTQAAKWLEALTDGAYSDLRADRELNVRLSSRSDPTFRSWEYLSGATVDQAYLALRLALADTLAQDADLPILLDDPLVQYDDGRARSAIHALLHRPGQTLLFTCQERMRQSAGQPEENGYTWLRL